MDKKRPIVTRIVAAIITAVSAFYVLVFLKDLRGISGATGYSIGYYLQVVFLISVLILTVSGVGLFFLKRWARLAVLFGAFLLLVHLSFVIVASLTVMREGLWSVRLIFYWWIVLHGADLMVPFILYYFTRPKVKEQFRD